MLSRLTFAALCLLELLGCATPALAKGGDGRREARVSGSCGKGATSQLRLRSRDGAISVEFELKRRRAGEPWRLVLVHERRVASRARLRTKGSSGSLRMRRTLDDLDGPDAVTVRASGPRGMTCEASATLAA